MFTTPSLRPTELSSAIVVHASTYLSKLKNSASLAPGTNTKLAFGATPTRFETAYAATRKP